MVPSFDMPLTQLTPEPSSAPLQPLRTAPSEFVVTTTPAVTAASTTPPTIQASAPTGAPPASARAILPTTPAQQESSAVPAPVVSPPSDSQALSPRSVTVGASATSTSAPASGAQPRQTGRSSRRRRSARTARGSGFTRTEVDGLLDLLEEIKPIGRDEWETVARRHNERHPGVDRTVESLRRKFAKLYKTNMGTGNPHMPDDVARAIAIANAITQRADLATGDDIAEDAEEIFEDEQSDNDVNHPTAVARPLVAPRRAQVSDNDGDDILSLARVMLIQDQRQRAIDREQQERWREEDRRQRDQDRAEDRERSNRLFDLLAAAFVGVAKAAQQNHEGN